MIPPHIPPYPTKITRLGVKKSGYMRLGVNKKWLCALTPLLLRLFWGVPGGGRDVCGGVRSANQPKVTRLKLFVLMRSKFTFIQTTPQSRYFVR
jgi:hypothetical protein